MLAPILALYKEEELEDKDSEMPKMLKVCIRAAQLKDNTYKRIKEKLEKGIKQDYKIMLAYTFINDQGLLLINNKLQVLETIRIKVVKAVYSSLETRHLGLAKTLFYLYKLYYQSNIH